MLGTHSIAVFEPIRSASGWSYLPAASSTQREPVLSYPLRIEVTQESRAQAKACQEKTEATAGDKKPKETQSAAPQKTLVPCAHDGCAEEIRPERVRCTKHTCHVKRCSAPAVDTPSTDFPYCSSHTCVAPGCIAPKTSKAQACRAHRCKVTDCLSAIAKGSFCKDHACRDKACEDQRANDAEHCPKHKCKFPNCNVAAQVEGGYCATAHGCAEQTCDKMRAANCELPLLCAGHNSHYHFLQGVEKAKQQAEAHFDQKLADLMTSSSQNGGMRSSSTASGIPNHSGIEPVLPKPAARKAKVEMRNKQRDGNVVSQMAVPPLRQQSTEIPHVNGHRSRKMQTDGIQPPLTPSRTNPLNAPQTRIQHPAVEEPLYPLDVPQMEKAPQAGFRRQTYQPENPQTEEDVVSHMRKLQEAAYRRQNNPLNVSPKEGEVEEAIRWIQEASMRQQMDPADLHARVDELDVGGPEETGVHDQNYSVNEPATHPRYATSKSQQTSVPERTHPRQAPLPALPLNVLEPSRRRTPVPVQSQVRGASQLEPSYVLSGTQQAYDPRRMNSRYAPVPELPHKPARQRATMPTQSSVLDAIQPDLGRVKPIRQQVHFATVPATHTTRVPTTGFTAVKLAVERGFNQLLHRQKTENQDFWRTHEPWETRDGHEELMDKHQVQRDAFMKVADERMAAIERKVPYGPRIDVPEGYEMVKQSRRHPVGSPRLETTACRDAYLRELYL